MNNKIVYLHKDQDGVVRYVGSGTRHRAEDWGKRNKEWHSIFDLNKPIVEIVYENLSEDECEKLEKELISKHKDTICNKFLSARRRVPLDYDVLSKVFYVDETSPSCLRWKVNNRLHPNQPNFRDAGDVAGKDSSSEKGRGFGWTVKYDYTNLSVNRIVYLLTRGSISNNAVIRHINNDPYDNRPENLIETTQSDVVRKSVIKKLPTSGHKHIREVFRDGFVVGYTVVVKFPDGKRKTKSFTSKLMSMEEKLENAKESLILLLKELNENL